MERRQRQRAGTAGHPPQPDPDELLTLAAAGRELPPRRYGARPGPSTLWRWARRGLAAGETTIKLRTTSVGGTTCTTRRWLREFFEALEQARADAREAAHAPEETSARTRTAQQESARKTLREAGILDEEKPGAPQGAVRSSRRGCAP